MLQLIQHVIRTSASRDRTEINGFLVDALLDMFSPRSVNVFRCFLNDRQPLLYSAAGYDGHERFLRNAYLPDRHHCHPLADDPMLSQAISTCLPVHTLLPGGGDRVIFPILTADRPAYVADIAIGQSLPAEERVALMGLLEYFGNHLALLEYGETDTLTCLSNRKTFDKHLFELLGRAAADEANGPLRADGPLRRRGADEAARPWLAIIDIDHFKRINDTHGHLIGDEVLVMLAHLMQDNFRFDDQLFRFGGEEFTVVIQPTSAEGARQTFQRFREAVERHGFSQVGKVTISIGMSQLMPNDTPHGVIDRADEALYFAKRHGRNQTQQYEALLAAGELAAKPMHQEEIELF